MSSGENGGRGGGGGGLLEGTLLGAPGRDPMTPAAARWANVSGFNGEEKMFIQL